MLWLLDTDFFGGIRIGRKSFKIRRLLSRGPRGSFNHACKQRWLSARLRGRGLSQVGLITVRLTSATLYPQDGVFQLGYSRQPLSLDFSRFRVNHRGMIILLVAVQTELLRSASPKSQKRYFL
jgi:hypothetical protein